MCSIPISNISKYNMFMQWSYLMGQNYTQSKADGFSPSAYNEEILKP